MITPTDSIELIKKIHDLTAKNYELLSKLQNQMVVTLIGALMSILMIAAFAAAFIYLIVIPKIQKHNDFKKCYTVLTPESLLNGKNSLDIIVDDTVMFSSGDLSASQTAAFTHDTAESKMHILQGPPGQGKTSLVYKYALLHGYDIVRVDVRTLVNNLSYDNYFDKKQGISITAEDVNKRIKQIFVTFSSTGRNTIFLVDEIDKLKPMMARPADKLSLHVYGVYPIKEFLHANFGSNTSSSKNILSMATCNGPFNQDAIDGQERRMMFTKYPDELDRNTLGKIFVHYLVKKQAQIKDVDAIKNTYDTMQQAFITMQKAYGSWWSLASTKNKAREVYKHAYETYTAEIDKTKELEVLSNKVYEAIELLYDKARGESVGDLAAKADLLKLPINKIINLIEQLVNIGMVDIATDQPSTAYIDAAIAKLRLPSTKVDNAAIAACNNVLRDTQRLVA